MEEALRTDWTIETNCGGHRTAISRMDHATVQQRFKNKLYEVIGDDLLWPN